jgi:hypothetical protein
MQIRCLARGGSREARERMPKQKREPDIIAIGPHTQAELYEAAVIHQALKALGRGKLVVAPADDGPLNLEPDEE